MLVACSAGRTARARCGGRVRAASRGLARAPSSSTTGSRKARRGGPAGGSSAARSVSTPSRCARCRSGRRADGGRRARGTVCGLRTRAQLGAAAVLLGHARRPGRDGPARLRAARARGRCRAWRPCEGWRRRCWPALGAGPRRSRRSASSHGTTSNSDPHGPRRSALRTRVLPVFTEVLGGRPRWRSRARAAARGHRVLDSARELLERAAGASAARSDDDARPTTAIGRLRVPLSPTTALRGARARGGSGRAALSGAAPRGARCDTLAGASRRARPALDARRGLARAGEVALPGGARCRRDRGMLIFPGREGGPGTRGDTRAPARRRDRHREGPRHRRAVRRAARQMAAEIEDDHRGKDLHSGSSRARSWSWPTRAAAAPRCRDGLDGGSSTARHEVLGRRRILKDLDTDLTGRHVLIVEDIVTWLTLSWLLATCARAGPPRSRSPRCCAPDAAKVDVDVRYVGFIPSEFVVGTA